MQSSVETRGAVGPSKLARIPNGSAKLAIEAGTPQNIGGSVDIADVLPTTSISVGKAEPTPTNNLAS